MQKRSAAAVADPAVAETRRSIGLHLAKARIHLERADRFATAEPRELSQQLVFSIKAAWDLAETATMLIDEPPNHRRSHHAMGVH